MNLIPGNVLFLVILGLCLAWSLPMTPENELGDLQPVGYQLPRMAKSEAESEFFGRIAPKGEHSAEEDKEYVITLEQLNSAGVKASDNRDSKSLSYRELVRLLALWHLSQERHIYEANGPDEQPDQAIDAHSV
ncbi:uncharacterized protein LOC108044245 [Drosophila rhopaloa]|uniref:Uncharacterized protein n=1 Tax=Drosophila rhopaloa TaxID=1041015 RepID=A0ABM5HDD9_DRORH|nr:uncharacterized protein LOC108044245 [Drosophila rhopaloa]